MEWKSNEILSLNHFVNDEHCIITYWYDSTDVIIPADSPYSHKGTARHMLLPPAWNTVTEHCPRCTDDWGRAKDGLRPCLSSWCHTSKQTGNHKPLPRMTEEEIIFEEFEDDLHEEIANDINFQSIDYHDAFKPLDEFVQTEEGAKLYKKALDDINRPHPHMGVVVNDYHDKLMHDIGVWHSTVLPQITDRADEKVHKEKKTNHQLTKKTNRQLTKKTNHR